MKKSYIYIIANKQNGTLYCGVTSDLIKRIYEHKNKTVNSFSKTHNLTILVYYEIFEDIYDAIKREKQIKNLSRNKKKDLIEKNNFYWEDLYNNLIY